MLNYSVYQRRREIGIRMAIGAKARDVVGLVTADTLLAVFVGALIGMAAGMASVRYLETLLYQVKADSLAMLAVPSVTILVAALVAALPAAIHAVRIDPAATLRSE